MNEFDYLEEPKLPPSLEEYDIFAPEKLTLSDIDKLADLTEHPGYATLLKLLISELKVAEIILQKTDAQDRIMQNLAFWRALRKLTANLIELPRFANSEINKVKANILPAETNLDLLN